MMTSLPNASSFLLMLLLLTPPVLTLTCNGSDSQHRPLDHNEQRVQSVVSAQTSSLSCFRSTDPDIRTADLLYDANNDEGNLWSREGELRPCSSISKPPPSRCAVCRDRFIHVVCCRNVTLEMEGEGRPIHIIKSECPQLQSEGTPRNAATGNHAGGPHWWFPVLISLFLMSINARF